MGIIFGILRLLKESLKSKVEKLQIIKFLNFFFILDLHKSGINTGTFDETGKVITGGNDNLIKVTKTNGVDII